MFELAAFFTADAPYDKGVEQDGDADARISIHAPEPMLQALQAIELWKPERFVQRNTHDTSSDEPVDPQDQMRPDFYVDLSHDPTLGIGTPAERNQGVRTIAFCEQLVEEKYWFAGRGHYEHDGKNWGQQASHQEAYHPYLFDAPFTLAGANDPRVWERNFGNPGVDPRQYPAYYTFDYFGGIPGATDERGKPDVQYWRKPDGRLYSSKPNGSSTVVWGRAWWPHYYGSPGNWKEYKTSGQPGPEPIHSREVAYRTVQHTWVWDEPPGERTRKVPNPYCNTDHYAIDGESEDASYATKLPAGRYVVVFRFAPVAPIQGGTYKIVANVMENPTTTYTYHYTFHTSEDFVKVYRARVVG